MDRGWSLCRAGTEVRRYDIIDIMLKRNSRGSSARQETGWVFGGHGPEAIGKGVLGRGWRCCMRENL